MCLSIRQIETSPLLGDSDHGRLFLPDHFDAVVVAERIDRARHIAVNTNGDIYAKLISSDSL